jgi:riboflavin kinase/FMN adenylyltransferase
MRVVDDLAGLSAALDSSPGAVVTIGVYDGVHRGHHAVLRLVRELADARGLAAVCITFDRHPAEVVRPESAPRLLTTPEQKLELLDATGFLDVAFVLHFDEARSREPATDFVREVLVAGAHARLVVVGADFHFGKDRGGDVALLQQMGAELDFEVIGVGLEAAPGGTPLGGTVYSSTRIRALLADGDVAAAAELLGRPHEVRGVVTEGDRRGRELGFPTANVTVSARLCLPADGIYAGTFLTDPASGGDGVERITAISLGRRPTFYEHADASLLEAHVLDFAGDLYGRSVRVRFHERLRGEQKFESVDALIAQMEQDVAATRAVLGAR